MAIKDRSFLEAALVGYDRERTRILDAMASIRAELRGTRAPAAATTDDGQPQRKRRKMSADARRRIAAAQKKRWAAYKKQKAAA